LISDAGIERAIVSHPSAHRSEFEATKVIVDKKVFKETFALGRIKKIQCFQKPKGALKLATQALELIRDGRCNNICVLEE